jgi:Uma2 family endonuclease
MNPGIRYTRFMAQSPTSTTHRHMSLGEFLARVDERPYLEYLNGEVVEKPVPGKKQYRIVLYIAELLGPYRRAHGGDAGAEPHARFDTPGGLFYRLPDVAYWAPDKPLGDDNIPPPPTLAIEIRSPGQSLTALRDKCRFMLANGVDVCWLIDPERRLAEVREGGEERTVPADGALESPAVPGFRLELAELFALLD